MSCPEIWKKRIKQQTSVLIKSNSIQLHFWGHEPIQLKSLFSLPDNIAVQHSRVWVTTCSQRHNHIKLMRFLFIIFQHRFYLYGSDHLKCIVASESSVFGDNGIAIQQKFVFKGHANGEMFTNKDISLIYCTGD